MPEHRTFLRSMLAIRDKVSIDGSDLHGTVTGIWWRNDQPQVEVSWVSDGRAQREWFEEWRLEILNGQPSAPESVVDDTPAPAEDTRMQEIRVTAMRFHARYKEGWEVKLRDYNEEFLTPPFPESVIKKIIEDIGA